MSQFAINLLFVGASFALYIGIAISARAGSTKEFYVAGGGVNPITNGMATAADWMSAASFISMAQECSVFKFTRNTTGLIINEVCYLRA
ncbi:Cation/acetate symporter ActP [Alishewanella longhuensis]